MILQYGTCNSAPEVVDKRPYFTILHTSDILAKTAISDRQPVITIAATSANADVKTCNYASMGGMYYRITDADTLPGGRYALHLDLDPLTSYADDIRRLSAVIVRQAGQRAPMLPDPAYMRRADVQIETRQFNRSPFSVNFSTDFCYVLSVIGGAATT